ncbi:DUF4364 family protein [Anaerotignum sp. MB30-C6]|uniref:DUF4364 family protein n=1 Tax=Anaerotignum sp. MB30-C6 TaxID=3070814 RepID=UPI0027DCDEA1|nr:DUF4364 family protein [Anaerotignum sp. MB30-C6]WMI81557.1 DUF4364 family protein [Anaerotignum sp. MB30-C6]
MADPIRQLAEHKLIILHLVQKMGISLSNSEICQFLLNKEYMDYFSVQQYLAELVEAGWLEKTKEHNNTRYTLTDEGEEVINYFQNHVKESVKEDISIYVKENSKRIRAEYAVTANYFPEFNGDFLVKCGLCDDDGAQLMEISVSVVSKQQAQQICRNWRKNVSHLYGNFLTALVVEDDQNPVEFKARTENFPEPTTEEPK